MPIYFLQNWKKQKSQTIQQKALFKNWDSFTNGINKICNTQLENAKDSDVVRPMFNVIECIVNYSKTSGSLSKYYRGESVLKNSGVIADFTSNDTSELFNLKENLTSQTGGDTAKDIERSKGTIKISK